MKRNRLIMGMVGALALTALVSCGDKDKEKGNELTLAQATEKVKNFQTEVSGTTVKLSYTANYNVDVNTNGGTANMDSFKHQIRATTVIEMDLGTDLYFKATKTKQDLNVGTESKKEEVLVYKADNKYYLTTTSTLPTEISSSTVKSTINEQLKAITAEQAGSIELSSLVYNKTDKSYELANFGLSDTFTKDDLADPTYENNDSNGLVVKYLPEYVGYVTDGGISDFKNKDGAHAATVNISTNDKGYITTWKEEYNTASLDFAIMSIPPTVIITGERSFVASYGDTLTKISEIEHTASVAKFEAATGGTYVVKTFAGTDFANMKDVTDGATLVLNNVLAIKPTAAEGKEIDTVTVNGNSTTVIPVANAGGFYCFNIVAGENKVVVTFKDSSTTPEPAAPTILYSYEGTAANKTAMVINFYNDGTFTITCPGFNNAKAVEGTYVLDQATSTMTLTSQEGKVNYMSPIVTYEVALVVASNMASMNTTQFFNGDTITFTYINK